MGCLDAWHNQKKVQENQKLQANYRWSTMDIFFSFDNQEVEELKQKNFNNFQIFLSKSQHLSRKSFPYNFKRIPWQLLYRICQALFI